MFSDSYLRDMETAVARSVKILNLLVVLISPLLSIDEDQVNYLRSLEIEAAFIGKSKAKDQEILYGGGGGGLLYCMEARSHWLDMKHSGKCSQKSFIKRILLLLLVMRCILMFIGKNINLFT